MSFASYERLPTLSTYLTARTRLANTLPIRGSVPVRVPLSYQRTDTQFGIRMAGDDASIPDPEIYKPCPGAKAGDIELLLYKQPVITFHENTQEFTIFCGTWGRWSAADCAFIESILNRYFHSVNTNRGRLILTCSVGGARYTVPKKGHIRFSYNEAERTVTPVEKQEQTTLRLNRKQTNLVRARYGEFYRYMKGMIGVRKVPIDSKWYDRTRDEYVTDTTYMVEMSYDEWTAVVPMEEVNMSWPKGAKVTVDKRPAAPFGYATPLRKPAKKQWERKYDLNTNAVTERFTTEPYENWLAVTEMILDLARTPAYDPDQHERFRQAFVWLAFYTFGSWDANHRQIIRIDVDAFGKYMDEIIFKYHSEEVFERVPAKHGAVPNLKYESWITREEEST